MVFCVFVFVINFVIMIGLLLVGWVIIKFLIKDILDEFLFFVMVVLFGFYFFVGGIGIIFYVFYFNVCFVFIFLIVFVVKILYNKIIEFDFIGYVFKMYEYILCVKGLFENENYSYLIFYFGVVIFYGVIEVFVLFVVIYCD